MLLDIAQQQFCILHRTIQTIIERSVVHEKSECSIRIVELFGHRLHIGQRLVHLLHRAIEVDVVQVLRQLIGIVEYTISLRHDRRHLLIEPFHERVELLCGRGKIGGNLLHVADGMGNSGIGKQGIHTRQDGIYLRQHLFNGRNQGGGTRHETFSHRATDGVAGGKGRVEC